MSADNYTKCPKCQSGIDSRIKNVELQYGKVSIEKYKALLAVAQQPKENIMREDYDIGIFEGEFSVSYRANCHKCGFSFRYEYTKNPLK